MPGGDAALSPPRSFIFISDAVVDIIRKLATAAFGRWQKLLNSQKYVIVPAMRLGRERQRDVIDHGYIRSSELELVAHEIKEKNMQGAVAELGVYTGDFAKLINVAFPDKKLYLFDTFEGFDKRDVETEKKHRLSNAKTGDFSDNSVELVLRKMRIKGNVIVKKGRFPQSLSGLEEKFCFVSIDVDLYLPTLEGLKYFFPRLVRGGYVFVHDYNSGTYGGVRKAVREFSQKHAVPYFPLTDSDGSAILMK